MKKTLALAILIAGFVLGCKYDRPLGVSSNKDTFRVRFTEHRTRDLRVLFCPAQKIEDLEHAQACSIEAGGIITKDQIISVGNGLSLDRVVYSLFGREYDGQVKVVSRNSIVQTSIIGYNPSEQRDIRVKPGDLVFIEGRD